MGLSTVRELVVGSTRVVADVDSDVLDIARRIRDGDPTCGWLGDDTLSLHLAVEVDSRGEPLRGGGYRYEVWGVDAGGSPYIGVVWPRCDASLLQELAKADVRTQDVAARIDRANAAVAATAAQRTRDAMDEAGDKFHHALLKDIGHLEGGLTKRVH